MPAPLINFPLSAIVDGIISYLQWVFNNNEITPAEYRWSSDDRATRIRISGAFVIDNEKPMSAPFVVVERGTFVFANNIIDNVKSADANTFENMQKVDIMDGYINIICGSGVAAEASSIANFLAIMFQADRHGIKKKLQFVRNLNYIDVSPEIPVFKDTEVRRWEVTLRLSVSMQMGWISVLREPVLFNSAGFFAVDADIPAESESGIVSEGSDLLTDPTKNFGFLATNNPQLIESELEKGWYYVRFVGNSELYPISEIIHPTKLRLLTHDANNDPVPYSAPESLTDVEYDLFWNSIHLRGDVPNNNT